MSTASVIRLSTTDPADTSGLSALRAQGLDVGRVRAVVGKTEGNGCVNDFSRALAARAWSEALGPGVVTVMSGGTEGVMSPHVTLLIDADDEPDGPPGALALGVAVSAEIAPADLGRRPQVDAVSSAVAEACHAAEIPPAEAQLVLVKCPLLTSDVVRDHNARGDTLVTTDPLVSMGRSRGASALGVALALGEIDSSQADQALAGAPGIWSSRASTSSGIEVCACHVVVLGHSPTARGYLRASHVVMRDAIDAAAVIQCLERIKAAGGEVIQVFAKAEPDASGVIRGRRHTMLTDSDLAGTRHARAAVAGLLAGLVGETAIYVSGGAEHQGPPGGGPVTVIWSLPRP